MQLLKVAYKMAHIREAALESYFLHAKERSLQQALSSFHAHVPKILPGRNAHVSFEELSQTSRREVHACGHVANRKASGLQPAHYDNCCFNPRIHVERSLVRRNGATVRHNMPQNSPKTGPT
jgi:hypothetical protein